MAPPNRIAAVNEPPGGKPNNARLAPEEAPLYIATEEPTSRLRRSLKHNDTFAVFDAHGDVGATAGGPDGLFDRDTRLLSHLELRINGKSPLLLGSAINDTNLNYYVDLTNPDIYADDKIALPKDTIHIGRTILLYCGCLQERLALSNHGPEETRVTVSLSFASDFADIFEVRGVRRSRRGSVWSRVSGASTIVVSYHGLDGARRETRLSFDPAPTQIDERTAVFSLSIKPRARQSIFVSVSGRGEQMPPAHSFFMGFRKLSKELKIATRAIATVETSNEVINEIMCRSIADLYMLATITPDGLYPYAGIPWYSTTFGRDGLITALQMLWIDPTIAAGVLRRLARYQATSLDPRTDAAPGKIPHEMRCGEMASLGEIPFGLYYGSVDATPLFVLLAGCYVNRTGDIGLIRELWPAIESALGWIDGQGDCDGDGFVEYACSTEKGLANQGWKDSHDAIFHADGRLAKGPIALVEVQGYVYAAKKMAGMCARRLGMCHRASELDAQANALRKRFEAAFWCENLSTYALALDGDKARCEVLTSNAGHVLATGIARSDRARIVAHKLLQPSFFSGWGIRTVAQGEARYNPMSYHNGSIWPHDNALIACGLARYGMKNSANVIFEAMIRATNYFDQRRIPELYCGFRRRPGRGPTLYPVACSPQAWAASAPVSLLQSMLGLEFDHPARRILLVNPSLPASVGRIIIRNLALGDANIDFAVCQEGDAVSIEVLRTAGDLQISLIFDANA
jgi:glycogen debranching enzyme